MCLLLSQSILHQPKVYSIRILTKPKRRREEEEMMSVPLIVVVFGVLALIGDAFQLPTPIVSATRTTGLPALPNRWLGLTHGPMVTADHSLRLHSLHRLPLSNDRSSLHTPPFAARMSSTAVVDDVTNKKEEEEGADRDIVEDFDRLLMESNDDDEDEGETEMTDEEHRALLKDTFQQLSQGRGKLSFEEFMRWEEIHTLIEDKVLTEEEVKSIWVNQCGKLDEEADEEKFLLVNDEVDALFENAFQEYATGGGDDNDNDKDEAFTVEQEQRLREILKKANAMNSANAATGGESKKKSSSKSSTSKTDEASETNTSEDEDGEGNEEDDEFNADDYIDIFDPSIDPEELMHESDVKELKAIFAGATATSSVESTNDETADKEKSFDLSGRMSFEQFLELENTKDILENSLIAEGTLSELWKHAATVQKEQLKETPSHVSETHGGPLTWPTFLRFMIRLEALLAQVNDAAATLDLDGIRDYCRQSFYNLTEGQEQLSFEQFLKWEDLNHIFEQQIMTQDEAKQLWNFEAYKKDPSAPQDDESIANLADATPTATLNFDNFLSLYETLETYVTARIGDDDEEEDEEGEEGEEREEEETSEVKMAEKEQV